MPRLAGLLLSLLLASCAAAPAVQAPPGAAERAAAADWSRATDFTLTLDEFEFTPAQFTLRAGVPVRLRLVNTGARAHDFTSPDLFTAVALRPQDAAAVLAAGGSVEVPAGQMREVYLLPLTPGFYLYDCEKPLHASLGMRGRVTVE
ncbi:cupredoxin domain-containing protein [Falsiroseomonas sp. HW251]|uniref:cupredoxin domain-containing protein n=1 Tax=Falsiroseomonas sp. HW251 TaxID=3390998 RepID=UPI003D32151B